LRIREGTFSPLLFSYFFLITFSIYVVKPAKESLFMEALGKPKLPYAFLLTAILMGVAAAVNSRLIERLRRPILVFCTLGFFILTGLIFWVFIQQPRPWPWTFLLFWSWADILLATTITQFWIMVNDLFQPREAKRRIGFFVSGGLLGGIAGSLLVYLRPGRVGAENLVLFCPAILTLALGLISLIWRKARREGRGEEVRGGFGRPAQAQVGLLSGLSLLRQNRYMLYLSSMMVVAIIVSNLVDFQFKALGKAFFPDKDATASFFAVFNLGLLVFSFFVSALLASRILKKFGMRVTLLIPPVFLFLGSLAVFFIPAGALLIWVIAMKGTDKSLTHSLNQSVREILYIPLPQEIKYRAKVVVDMLLNKFADGVTGLVLIAFSAFLKLSPWEVSLLAIVFLVAWMALNFQITREYVNIVKRNLQIKWPDADKIVSERIDMDMTRLVFDALQSRERSSVLYAMNLFDLIKKEKLSPSLKRILAARESELRARSLDTLLDMEGEPLLPEIDDSLDPRDLDAQIQEIMSLDVYQQLIGERVEKAVREKGAEAEVTRMEAAKAMGMMPSDSPLVRQLRKLLEDESAEVARYAAESAGRLKRKELVPYLVRLLGRAATQEVAKQALEAYGESIIGTLSDVLRDGEESLPIRRAIPDILARTSSEKAVMALTSVLKKDDPAVENELIEALHRMRSNRPALPFDEKAILARVTSLIQKCYLLFIQIHDLRSDKKKEILARELEGNLARAMKHIFELLGLILPQEDIIRAYQNLQLGTKKSVDYSIELLENILRKDIKEMLLPLVEDRPFEDKVRFSRRMLKAFSKKEST